MFHSLGLAIGMALKLYTNVAKVLKLKVKKFQGLILTFAEVSIFYTFGVASSEESVENPPSRIKTQLIHKIYDKENYLINSFEIKNI